MSGRGGLPVRRQDRPFIAWYGDMDLLPHLAGDHGRAAARRRAWPGASRIAFDPGADRKAVDAAG